MHWDHFQTTLSLHSISRTNNSNGQWFCNVQSARCTIYWTRTKRKEPYRIDIFRFRFVSGVIDCGRNGLWLEAGTVCGWMNQTFGFGRRYDAALCGAPWNWPLAVLRSLRLWTYCGNMEIFVIETNFFFTLKLSGFRVFYPLDNLIRILNEEWYAGYFDFNQEYIL